MGAGAAEVYRGFAAREVRGVSAVYFGWATGIADDLELLSLLDALPGMKKQPNLLFGAARLLGAPVGTYADLRPWLLEHWSEVVAVVVSHSTQTNEAGRCAVLMPVLCRVARPLALIEAGTSAGLCLYPDRYSYRYDTGDGVAELDPSSGPSTVVLPCRIDAGSVPARIPEVVWRAGVDLNPIASDDAEGWAWLDALIWPEHQWRRDRLAAAREIAAAEPSLLVRGDLVDAIPDLVATAPRDAQVVVFHSAVLAYLDAEHRERFGAVMRSMPGVLWISNEGEGVVPRVARRLRRSALGNFVLAADERPVALVGPHGQSFEAL